MTVPKCYFANALTGGSDGCLDAIDGALLVHGDGCYVASVDGTFAYFYRLVDLAGQSGSSPTLVSPLANAGNKRWNRLSPTNWSDISGVNSCHVLATRATTNQAITATGAYQTIVFNNTFEATPAGSLNTSTGVFTAPFTGKFHICCSASISAFDSSATYYSLSFISTARSYNHIHVKRGADLSADFDLVTISASLTIPMAAGDTLTVAVYQSGGTVQSDIRTTYTYLSITNIL